MINSQLSDYIVAFELLFANKRKVFVIATEAFRELWSIKLLVSMESINNAEVSVWSLN